MTTTFHEIDNTAMRTLTLTLACATTSHALLAPRSSSAAQTVRHVKIDSNNLFFRALDGAKELAFTTGDLARDAGALAKDVKARAKEAQAQKPNDASAAKAPFASAFTAPPTKVDAPAKKAPFKFMNAATPKKVDAAPAFDLSVLTAPAKENVDAAAKSLKAAPDALKATATGYLTAVQDAAAAVAASPKRAKERLDATVATVEATAEAIAKLPADVANAADSVGSAVTGTVDAVAAIPETVKSTAEAVAAVPEKIGSAVDGAVATAQTIAAVPGKVAEAGAGAVAAVSGGVSWFQSILPNGPPQLTPPPEKLRSAQPAQKKPVATPILDVKPSIPAWADVEEREDK